MKKTPVEIFREKGKYLEKAINYLQKNGSASEIELANHLGIELIHFQMLIKPDLVQLIRGEFYSRPMKYCPKCERVYDTRGTHCPVCGTPLRLIEVYRRI